MMKMKRQGINPYRQHVSFKAQMTSTAIKQFHSWHHQIMRVLGGGLCATHDA